MEIRESEARDARAVARIRDHGPGIPEEHLELIFSRFFSYRDNGPSGDGHTGLGLAIVRTIVEGYGGTVAARNAAGGGAELRAIRPHTTEAKAVWSGEGPQEVPRPGAATTQ